MPETPTDIYSLQISEIEELLKALDQPRFRAKQLIRWLYINGVSCYEEMTNLPLALRSTLSKQYPLIPPVCVDKQASKDGTRKYVLEYADKTRVETVGIPSLPAKSESGSAHLSVCVSTQAGCAMNCAFCATGKEGLSRNLSSGEIVAQILAVQHDFGQRVSHVVMMGQGEPFQNYEALFEALRFINSPEGLAVGARHITVSTCGLLTGIERFSKESEQFTLAVSLHSARQEIRDQLMPRCQNMPLNRLKLALLSYGERTSRRVSLEYLLIRDTNDSEEDLLALLDFCSGLHCHINLIPLNKIEGAPFQPSLPKTQKNWVQKLSASGHETTVRNSRGSDIQGACGQLKNKLRS